MEVNEEPAEAGPVVGAAPAASQSADVFFCSSHRVEAERSISLLMDAQSLHLHSGLNDCCCCGLERLFFYTPLGLPGTGASKICCSVRFYLQEEADAERPDHEWRECTYVKADTVSMAFYFLKMQLHKRCYCLLLGPQNESKPSYLPSEFSTGVNVGPADGLGGSSWNGFHPSSSKINQSSDNKPRPLNVALFPFKTVFDVLLRPGVPRKLRQLHL